MKNHIEKAQEYRKKSKNIFNEIFGLGSNKNTEDETSGNIFEDSDIIITSGGKLEFKSTGSSIEKLLPNYGWWSSIDWSNKNINWLLNAKFHFNAGEIIGIGTKRKVNILKDGVWIEGDFRGGKIVRTSFKGGTFIGHIGEGSRWEVSPFNFVDGTTYETETLLGMKNITNFNQDKFKLNILSVPPRRKITLILNDNVRHEITVIKRLDKINSNFSYKVKNGYNNQELSFDFPWSQIRGSSHSEFEENTVLSNLHVSKLISDLFRLPIKGSISKIIIGDAVGLNAPSWDDNSTEEELSSEQESFDLNQVPFLKIGKLKNDIWDKGILVSNVNARVFFNFPDSEYKEKFDDASKNLINRTTRSDFDKLRSFMDNRIISGAPASLPYLSSLIGVDPNFNVSDENFINSLKRIEMFLKYFVDRIMKYSGKSLKSKGFTNTPDKPVQNLIKSRLKSIIGLNQSPENVDNKTEKRKRKTGNISESYIRNEIIKVLSKNLKQK